MKRKKFAQKVFDRADTVRDDRADTVRDVRLRLPGVRGIQDSNLASVAARERGRGQGFDAVLVDRCLVYGKNDPFRSWPISANELEEVTIGSETNV